jgi:hypothetical protein
MKKLLVLFMGGNNTLVWNPTTENLSYPIDGQQPEVLMGMVKDFSDLKEDSIIFQTICFKDSTAITAEDQQQALQAILGTDADAILILYGEKTQLQMAAFLKDNLPADFAKPLSLLSNATPACVITESNNNNENSAADGIEATLSFLDDAVNNEQTGISTCTADGVVNAYEAQPAEQ